MVEAGANGSTTLYAWAGGSVIAEYNGVGSGMAWTKSYVYLGGRLLATDATSGLQYHHPDRLGTRLVTNTSGGIVSENIGLPFGNTISGESNNLAGSDSKKRFTSYDRSDNTKLDYAVNRHYSAAQGRFTQVDPIEMDSVSLEDPQSLNLYAYCGNDPINRTDPDGLFFKKLFRALGKALKWIAIAAIVAVAILTFVAPTALASLSIWASNHATLAALLGINTPHYAIINIAATAGGATASLGIGASISALVGAVGSLLSASPQSADLQGLRELKEFQRNPECFKARKQCEAKCSGEFFRGAANTATAIGGALYTSGLPLVPKPFVTPGSSGATSIASTFFRKIFPDTKLPSRWPAPTFRVPYAQTTRLATFLGRMTPIVGASVAAGGIMLGGSLSREICVEKCLQAGGKGKCK